jgi:DNA-binding transcriptional MerR regulator
MRIGELARDVGVSTDAVRFYERAGWLPRPQRRENDYREYSDTDVEHLRLLVDLRRLEIPLEEAAQIAGWCHAGHCLDTTEQLPALIAARRAAVAERIARLQELDDRLARLSTHVRAGRRTLPMIGAATACCDAAGAVMDADGACNCCQPGLS